ncbi:MAG: heavy metal-responsive transcriptional regulator [Porticoccaceae bacterium]|nr:heavy metal-responsive transcriptional regulator [Porticoccaceae bacterium]
MTKLTIGRLANSASVGVETVRYYERRGLIRQPPKHGGFREYSRDDIARIHFIKRAQELGFSLTEIEQLLDLSECKGNSRAQVKQLTKEKICEIRRKIEHLTKLEATLTTLHERCNGRGSIAGCPIIESIVTRSEQSDI